jgi:hypothetical protein
MSHGHSVCKPFKFLLSVGNPVVSTSSVSIIQSSDCQWITWTWIVERLSRPVWMQEVHFNFILLSKCLYYTAKPQVAIILSSDVTLQVLKFHSFMVMAVGYLQILIPEPVQLGTRNYLTLLWLPLVLMILGECSGVSELCNCMLSLHSNLLLKKDASCSYSSVFATKNWLMECLSDSAKRNKWRGVIIWLSYGLCRLACAARCLMLSPTSSMRWIATLQQTPDGLTHCMQSSNHLASNF